MNIVTDGTITAQEAVGEAVKIIINHYNWIDGQLNHASLTEKIQAASETKEEDNSEEGNE
jgi:DNA-directed RNA polymerase alpha subunit